MLLLVIATKPGGPRRKMPQQQQHQDMRDEKKAIDEKVAAVREVVHTASNNDIILALHNFDMDVGRTIQAFCEGECFTCNNFVTQ